MTYDGFPPFISAQLHYLINHFAHPVRVEQAWSGSKYSNTLDRFTLLIPYCLDTIKWDVIYNAEFPHVPPDVIFGPEDEDFHPFYNESGGEGDSRDQYMSYQRKRVGEVDDDRLKFEICTMLSREGIEMHTSSGVEKVIYPVNRKYVSAPSAPHLKLMSTPALKSLFSVDDVKLPPWLDGMCMAEYLPHLEEALERQVSEAVSLIEVRRRFIEALAPLFGRPIETDSVFYRKSMFFVASGAFSFLYFNSQGMPIKSPLLTDYPWSPRWEHSQMAERTFEYLVDESVNFKKYCNEAQLQQNQH
ncbi:BRCA1-A complex subunit BRE [Citrus sinensis]|nr:BRCA1-A complex subunit BRE [Citrus sinensis]